MIKKLIIGSGFSAVITKMLLGKGSKIIGSIDHQIPENSNFLRRKSLEVNKFFSKKALSYGTLKFNLRSGKLHDRLIIGGNSNIWGGHINIKRIKTSFFEVFRFYNIIFQPLSYKTTGTVSNNKNIYQLQSSDFNIFKVQDLPFKIKNGYVKKFYINKKKIYVELINSNFKVEKIQIKKLYLCIGTIQLIDLLYRSNFLYEGDSIQFSEFEYNLKFKLFNSKFSKKIVTIRYHFSRAIGHLFGIQHYSKFFKYFSFLPFYIDQNFLKKKNTYNLIIKNKTVVEKKNQKIKPAKFGKSIHYCDMKINGIKINKYLSKINSNIKGVGTSFINQKVPGPISNDIILNIKK